MKPRLAVLLGHVPKHITVEINKAKDFRFLTLLKHYDDVWSAIAMSERMFGCMYGGPPDSEERSRFGFDVLNERVMVKM